MKEFIMKTIHFYAGVVAAGMLAATAALAGRYDGDPDLEHSILNDVDRPAYVGTSLPDARARVHIYDTSDSAFQDNNMDRTGFVTGTAGPEKGYGDLYGSILFDTGALR
jgi:hypothetical protein